MKLVPDTSVVIDGRITSLIKSGEYKGATIIIPEAVVAELEAQANQGREIGFSGLTELQELCTMAAENVIDLKFTGVRPTLDQVKLASGGEIDALIRNVALEYEARFITSDIVQAEVGKAKGIEVTYLRPQINGMQPLGIDQFFDENTIAIYLKDRVPPVAKRGSLKDMRMVRLRESPCSEYELRSLAQEIIERAKRDPDGFIELEKRGVTVVQIGSLRISITRKPFSDGMEITAVRPIVDISLEDYKMAPLIRERVIRERCGVIIAGPPGSGKTTLAQSIATYLADGDFIVKTMESPRDLQVPDHITQYTSLDGTMEKTADLLLLVRPDFVIFNELRKNEDFSVFADMRLSGIKMVGVLHAQQEEDAIRRFFDRVGFAVIPQVITTIIFVREGEITSIHDVEFAIKVPEGMSGEVHVRPVILVKDATTAEVKMEIYRYDGETIIMPVASEGAARPETPHVEEKLPGKTHTEREGDIQREIGRYTRGHVEVRMNSDNKAVVYIDDRDVPAAIGKGGKNVAAIVNKLGIGIDIRPNSELGAERKAEEDLEIGGGIHIHINKKELSIVSPEHKERIVDVFAGKEYLFTATVDENGEIHLAKNSTIAQELIRRSEEGEGIRLRPV